MVAIPVKEHRNTAKSDNDFAACGVPLHGVSRAERESSGNGWHTTYAIGVVCYTAIPQTAKTVGFHCPLAVSCETAVEQFTVSTLRCCGVPYANSKSSQNQRRG